MEPRATILDAIRAVSLDAGQIPDSVSLDCALEAHSAGRPVYWHTRPYHDAFATIFIDLAHRCGLRPALQEMERRHPTHPEARPDKLLARLVPITASARVEMHMERARLATLSRKEAA